MNNQITLIGHVGQTPVSKLFGDTGNKVVKFSLSVKDYSSKSEDMWIDVDAWNGIGDRVLATVTKGREVVVMGRLALSTYSKEENGVTVQMTKPVVKLTAFHLCGKKPEAEVTSITRDKPAKSKKLATG